MSTVPRILRLLGIVGVWLVALLELLVQLLVYAGPEATYDGGFGGVLLVVLLSFLLLSSVYRNDDPRTEFGQHPVAHMVGMILIAVGIAHQHTFYTDLPAPTGGVALIVGLSIYPTTRVESLDTWKAIRKRLAV